MVIFLFQVRSFFFSHQDARRAADLENLLDYKTLKFYGQLSIVKLGGYDVVTTSKLWRQVGLENPSILQSMAALMFHDGNSLHIWFVFCEKVSFSAVD
ncbi:hypothetical protein YC2023_024111 [Brassica napus]